MKKFYRGLISATTLKEAKDILQSLALKKLVAGGLISEGLSSYWWEGEIQEKKYYNISVFTNEENRTAVIQQVKSIHSDEVPIIALFEISDGNTEFLNWIDESVTSLK